MELGKKTESAWSAEQAVEKAGAVIHRLHIKAHLLCER